VALAWSTLYREVERFLLGPLSWERGLNLQSIGLSTLYRKVEYFLLRSCQSDYYSMVQRIERVFIYRHSYENL
jgi:hypothetical protein